MCIADMHSINDYRFTKLQKFVRLHADDYDSRNSSEHKTVQQQQVMKKTVVIIVSKQFEVISKQILFTDS